MDMIDDVPIRETDDASDPVPGGQQSIRFDGRGLDTPTPNGSFDSPPGTIPQQLQSFATRSERHQLSNPAELLNESNHGGQDPYQNILCTSRQEYAIKSSGDDVSICSHLDLPPNGASQIFKNLHLKLTSSAVAVQKEEDDESNQSGVASGHDGDLCKASGQLHKRTHDKESYRRLAKESRDKKKKVLQEQIKKHNELLDRQKKTNGASQMLPQPDAVAFAETGNQDTDYCIDNLRFRNMNDEQIENTSGALNLE